MKRIWRNSAHIPQLGPITQGDQHPAPHPKLRPTGLLSGLRGSVEQHIDIVDYPGEWLLDLGLMYKTYEEWSTDVLHRMASRAFGADYVNTLTDLDPSGPFTDAAAKSLAACFTDYLENARAAGYSDLSPGRFLLPGDMSGSPALTFAPVPKPTGSIRKTFWAEMKRRYDAYKTHVVRPFFGIIFPRLIDRLYWSICLARWTTALMPCPIYNAR